MKRLIGLVMVGILVLGAAGIGLAAEEITIRGSTTVLPIGARWAEAFMEINPQIAVSVFGGGSGVGISALIEGTTDIAMASRFMRMREFEMAVANGVMPIAHEVAVDGLSIVVHPDNPLTEITIEQVAAIYLGEITNWKELGGADMRIVVFSRDTASGTYGYFVDEVLDDGLMRPDVLYKVSNAAIAGAVARTPGGIGYVGIGFMSEAIVALAVAREGDEFVYPSLETVADGSYPLSRSLFLFTDGWPKGIIASFIRFIQSPAGQQLVMEEGFSPIPRD